MQVPQLLLAATGALVLSALVLPTHADLVISEFLAVNDNGLADEDGDDSDWIEILNTGPDEVDLAGYYLTDDGGNLVAWKFPALPLAAGDNVVVFASDKDRSDPDSELHTNFKLSSSGEYLALVAPDGLTVVDSFTPNFPPQFVNVSFGRPEDAASTSLIIAGADCRWRVPSDASEDDVWRDPDFDDTAWTAAQTGVGYEASIGSATDYTSLFGTGGDIGAANMRDVSPSAYLRVPFDVTSAAAIESLLLEMKFDDGFTAYINGFPVASSRANSELAYDSGAAGDHPDTAALEFEPFNLADGIEYLQDGTNVLAIHGLNNGVGSSDFLLVPRLTATTSGALSGSTTFLALPTPGAANGGAANGLGPSIGDVTETAPRPVVNSAIVNDEVVFASSSLDFSGVQGQDGWSYGYYDVTADVDQSYAYDEDFTPFPGGAGMGGWSDGQHWTGSAWDFNPDDNGGPVNNGNPPWTVITATSTHPNDSTPGPEHYSVRRWTSDIAGEYVIEGLFNNTSTGGDGTTGRVLLNGTEIFAQLTDGDIANFSLPVTLSNGDVVDFLVDTGPADNDGADGTTFEASVLSPGGTGAGGDPVAIPITAEIAPTTGPITSVSLFHRIGFDAETTVTMTDDGVAPDTAAGDGIYTGLIETTTLLDGQMLRWRIEASDDEGTVTSSPAYPDPLDSPRYYGTVATNPLELSSSLPILHWFVENPAAAGTDSGTRGAVFYDGEFYDNIQTDRHGQSTRNFNKRSYDIDFNAGDRFRWAAEDSGERRVKDINLLTNWADKSKVRHSFAYEIFAAAGAAHHYGFPVRVQQNGQFFSTADLIEDGDDRYLERLGFDGDDALYKMYNSLNGWNAPGALKKTRKDDGTADLQALVEGLDPALPEAQRENYLFDHVNIPETINYLAAMVIVANRDHGHKNYYMYRDTNGTGEWAILVWDLDLSFGHNWISGPGYFDDTISADTVPNERNGITAGVSNRLRDLIFGTSDVREMFVRRLRTVMDDLIQPPGTPEGESYLETRLNEIADQIDPPGVMESDAALDYAKWGSWGNMDTMREGFDRVINDYFPRRRAYLYEHPNNSEIPDAQTAAPTITIGQLDFNPVSGNQDEEYLELSNPNGFAVDISGWKLDDAIDFTFIGGTVIPAGGDLIVAKNAPAFRARATGPTGGERRLVVSGYGGQLSARGEMVSLTTAEGTPIDSMTYPGEPTVLQSNLRITEINYHPASPTAAELAAVPGLDGGDFEFIELRNISPTLTIDLGGAHFTDGITFTFPASTMLGPGEHLVLVANPAAFAARYPVGATVVGPYSGQLDNNGEKIQIADAAGENILTFDYNDSWYDPTDGEGRTLVIRDDSISYTDWDRSSSYRISGDEGGDPGEAPAGFATNFQSYLIDNFTSEERDDDALTGPDVDGDGDGFGLFAEFALGLDRDSPDHAPVTATALPDARLGITFNRPQNALGVEYEMEFSSDLVGWTPFDSSEVTVVANPDGTETVTLAATEAFADTPLGYVRIVVSEMP